MIDLSFLTELKKFSLIINKRITSNYSGARESTNYGRGLVLRDRREYVPGDDFRDIDWRVYARTDKLHVRRYEEERNLTVHVIIDFSGSMGFGNKISKSEFASMIGLGFAYTALRNNERFVLSTFSDSLDLFRPRKGKAQMAGMVEYLENKKPGGVSNFKEALAKYKGIVKSRALVVILSDFLYDLEELRYGLLRFKNSDVIVVQVLDESERKLSVEGEVILKDSESDTLLETYVSPRFKKKYLDSLNSHTANIQQICDRMGAKFYSVSTGDDIFSLFYNMLS